MSEFGEFWVRKMRTAFQRLDLDNDGVLTEGDFSLMAKRFIEAGQLTGKDAEDVKAYYIHEIWQTYFKSPTEDRSTPSDMLECMKRQGKKNILSLTNDIHARYFKIIDTNRTGSVQLHQFGIYFNILGIDQKYLKQAFNDIDVNRDGTISRGEFITAGNDFFNAEEEGHAGDLLFGPLLT